jgi:hypothetical protein
MEWLMLIPLMVFIILLFVASNNTQPTWMSCKEMRSRHGTPKRSDARLPGGGYQPAQSELSEPVEPPPKHR